METNTPRCVCTIGTAVPATHRPSRCRRSRWHRWTADKGHTRPRRQGVTCACCASRRQHGWVAGGGGITNFGPDVIGPDNGLTPNPRAPLACGQPTVGVDDRGDALDAHGGRSLAASMIAISPDELLRIRRAELATDREAKLCCGQRTTGYARTSAHVLGCLCPLWTVVSTGTPRVVSQSSVICSDRVHSVDGGQGAVHMSVSTWQQPLPAATSEQRSALVADVAERLLACGDGRLRVGSTD
jgi:hypothetical protein